MDVGKTKNSRVYLISEVSDLTGLPSKTIRYYEDIKLIPPPKRNESGYRIFSGEDIKRLKLIKKAKFLGISLDEIKKIIDIAFNESCGDFEEKFVELLKDKVIEVNDTIDELYELRKELIETYKKVNSETEKFKKDCKAGECEECAFIDEEKLL